VQIVLGRVDEFKPASGVLFGTLLTWKYAGGARAAERVASLFEKR
jgi:hypothetical protein